MNGENKNIEVTLHVPNRNPDLTLPWTQNTNTAPTRSEQPKPVNATLPPR